MRKNIITSDIKSRSHRNPHRGLNTLRTKYRLVRTVLSLYISDTDQFYQLGDDLMLITFGQDHTGTYTCKADNAFGHIESEPAEISLKCEFSQNWRFFQWILVFGKKWKAVPQNVVVSVGETIKIPCIPPDGFPEPTIEWFKGNNFLSLGMFSYPSSSLGVERQIENESKFLTG